MPTDSYLPFMPTLNPAPGVFDVIFAAGEFNREIGYRGDLPWPRAKGDLLHFKRVTSAVEGSHVIFGFKTAERLLPKVLESDTAKPLPGRKMVVVTTSQVGSYFKKQWEKVDVLVVGSLDEALALPAPARFVAGGESIYNQVAQKPYCSKIGKTFWTNIAHLYAWDRKLSHSAFCALVGEDALQGNYLAEMKLKDGVTARVIQRGPQQ